MKTLLFISFLTTFYVFAQRDPRPKDQANVFWNGAYSLYSLSSDEEIKPNSSGKYEFWGTTNENPQPIQYSLMKGNTLYVYKFISYSECLNSCNEIRKSKGLALLQTNQVSVEQINNTKPTINLKSVVIGTQTWTTENLNVSTFRNGDPIPEAKTAEEWINAGKNKQASWCYYDNDPANGQKYGKLYNWYAVNDKRGLAPIGWHIPSDEEWTVLSTFLGGENLAGIKMKSTTGWNGNGNGNNSNGYLALPGGYRYENGGFYYVGDDGYWWGASEYVATSAWYRSLNYYASSLYPSANSKNSGFSVRCLKNTSESPIITNVKHESNIINNELLDKNKVVDADGNIYNTVRIRDKIWITENLKTKHYNDGQSIQQVEDHRTWAQLNTPAFCDPPSDFGYANDGLLYNHYVVERGNVCPKGFKVPTATVIDSLLNYYDGYDFGYLLGGFWRNYYDKTADFDDVASGKVKESLTLSGFNFLDGATRGYSFDDQDLDKGYSKYYQGFWLRDRKTKFDDEKYSSVVQLKWSEFQFSQSVRIEQTDIRSGNYIRCYKEYIPTISDDKIMTVKDKDDNLHKVVRIGNQVWMAEDLKTVPEQTRVVFNNEELEHYSESVFYDNFKSSGPVNYNYFNLTYYLDFDANFKDVCPQNWHLPDQGEWEIMIRNSNLKDLKSTTGWQIYKKPGYNETRRVECSNCKSGSQKYKDNCNVCRGNGFKIINTGKYIPEQITNYNGTNKSGMNIRPYPTYEYGKFDNNYYNSEVYYLVKDHRAKGFTLITFRLKDIEFDKFGPDLDTRAHIRCVKD